jgi:hypothetical protein
MHSAVERDLFYFLAIMNSPAVNMAVQIALWHLAFNSFGYIPSSGVTRSCGRYMSSFLRNFHPAYYSVFTILHSHKEYKGSLFYFAVLGFELRAYTLSHSTSHFFVKGFFEIGSRKLFAWSGFKPQSSWSLPPEYLGLPAWANLAQLGSHF